MRRAALLILAILTLVLPNNAAWAEWISRSVYTGNGATTDYAVGFPYITEGDVKVYIDDVLQDTADYSFPSATIVRFDTAPTTNSTIVFRRLTDKTVVGTLQYGNTPSTSELNAVMTRAQNLVQEAADAAIEGTLGQLSDDTWNAAGNKIVNLGTGTADDDAVTVEQLDDEIATLSSSVTSGLAGKQALDADLTSLAGSTGTKDSHTFYRGDGTFARPDFTDSLQVTGFFDDFFYGTNATTGFGDWGCSASGSAPGSCGATGDKGSGAPGVGLVHTQSTTATATMSRLSNNLILYGDGPITILLRAQVPILSDGTNTFTCEVGLADAINTTATVDGVEFSYDQITDGDFWAAKTISNSSATKTVSAVPIVAGQWYKLRIEINADATSVGFYVDDVLIATHTTNIPTGAGRATGMQLRISKTVSTAARDFYLDYYSFKQTLTTSR